MSPTASSAASSASSAVSNRADVDALVINSWKAIESLSKNALTVQDGQRRLQEGQIRNQHAISGLTSSLNHVAGTLHARIDRMEEDRKASEKKRENAEFRSGPRGQILLYLHHFFDGSTGNNCICPVTFVDHAGLNRELVVQSLPATERFFTEECPNKMDPLHVRSYFTSSDMKRALGLDYKDFITALLLSGFKFLAVGPGWNQERKRNTERFVIYEAEWYKSLLDRVAREMPDRPMKRDFIHSGRLPNYRNDGVNYGFLIDDDDDKSTGRIVQVSKSFSSEEAKSMVVQGQPWVAEWYTSFVARLFGQPSNMIGVCHIISSCVDATSGPVETHEKASSEYRARQAKQATNAASRKKKRLAKQAKLISSKKKRK